MFIAAGWAQSSILNLTQETDANIQALRSALIIEEINYTYGQIIVRNIADYNVSLTVMKIALFKEDGTLIESIPQNGFTSLANLTKGQAAQLNAPTCNTCNRGERLKYRIWYIPTELLEKGLFKSTYILYVESSFINPIGPHTQPACPLPNKWTLIDMVDPVTWISGQDGGVIASFYGRGKVWIKAPLASDNETINFRVTVEEIGSGRSGSGSDDVEVPSENQYAIYGTYNGLKVPFKITLSSPDTNVIPHTWVFGGKKSNWGRVHAHVSGIVIFWRDEDRKVENVMLEMGADEWGTYRVTLKLKDCNDAILYQRTKLVEFKPGSNTLNVFFRVSPALDFDQIYIVETEVR